jgi:multimeric flavodoxin WrbA
MDGLFRKMERSEVWVLGTPVYWWGPSAQFKTFVDRWYAKVFRPEDKALFEGRRVVLVIPMGDEDPATARHTVGMMQDALDYVKAVLFGTLLAPGMNERAEVLEHPEFLEAARRAGREAVQGHS